MKITLSTIALVASIGFSNLTLAAGDRAEGPCKQIKETCEKAGFVKGEAKEGFGLWVDCIQPIMQGKAQPTKAIKALPSVTPELVSQCKAKHPGFGDGVKKVKTK